MIHDNAPETVTDPRYGHACVRCGRSLQPELNRSGESISSYCQLCILSLATDTLRCVNNAGAVYVCACAVSTDNATVTNRVYMATFASLAGIGILCHEMFSDRLSVAVGAGFMYCFLWGQLRRSTGSLWISGNYILIRSPTCFANVRINDVTYSVLNATPNANQLVSVNLFNGKIGPIPQLLVSLSIPINSRDAQACIYSLERRSIKQLDANDVKDRKSNELRRGGIKVGMCVLVFTLLLVTMAMLSWTYLGVVFRTALFAIIVPIMINVWADARTNVWPLPHLASAGAWLAVSCAELTGVFTRDESLVVSVIGVWIVALLRTGQLRSSDESEYGKGK